MLELAVIVGKREILGWNSNHNYGALEEVERGCKEHPGIYQGSPGSAMRTLAPYARHAIGGFLLCYALMRVSLDYDGY